MLRLWLFGVLLLRCFLHVKFGDAIVQYRQEDPNMDDTISSSGVGSPDIHEVPGVMDPTSPSLTVSRTYGSIPVPQTPIQSGKSSSAYGTRVTQPPFRGHATEIPVDTEAVIETSPPTRSQGEAIATTGTGQPPPASHPATRQATSGHATEKHVDTEAVIKTSPPTSSQGEAITTTVTRQPPPASHPATTRLDIIDIFTRFYPCTAVNGSEVGCHTVVTLCQHPALGTAPAEHDTLSRILTDCASQGTSWIETVVLHGVVDSDIKDVRRVTQSHRGSPRPQLPNVVIAGGCNASFSPSNSETYVPGECIDDVTYAVVSPQSNTSSWMACHDAERCMLDTFEFVNQEMSKKNMAIVAMASSSSYYGFLRLKPATVAMESDGGMVVRASNTNRPVHHISTAVIAGCAFGGIAIVIIALVALVKARGNLRRRRIIRRCISYAGSDFSSDNLGSLHRSPSLSSISDNDIPNVSDILNDKYNTYA